MFHSDISFASRRSFLRSVSYGFGSVAFAAMTQRANAAAESPLAVKPPHFEARAKRVLMLCMEGGPSHVDTFDYKPELAKRSGQSIGKGKVPNGKLMPSPWEFRQGGESGLWISDLYPEFRKHADKVCLINSMQTDLPNHSQAFLQMHCGSFQFVRPSVGAWTLYGLGTENSNLPGFVTINPPSDNGGARNYGSGFLPAISQGTRVGTNQIPAFYAAILRKDQEPGPPLKNIENKNLSREQQRAQLDLVRSSSCTASVRACRRIASAGSAFSLADWPKRACDLSRSPRRSAGTITSCSRMN